MEDIMEMAAEIISAYVANNRIEASELPSFIKSVFAALGSVGAPPAAEAAEAVAKATPAQIRKSINSAGLVSFEDGRTYQTLKRHLTIRGLTPAEYRAKWGLPHDYPMTSSAYSERRSTLAKAAGLGLSGRGNQYEAPAAAPTAPVDEWEAAAPKASIRKPLKAKAGATP
jgi:predicted transcriptional regulator